MVLNILCLMMVPVYATVWLAVSIQQRRFRFSLSSLLFFTTLFALVMWLIVTVVRCSQ
jgi:hypothetical protein